MTHASYDKELVSDLNDLIQLDRDAIEAYTVAINSVRDASIRDALVANRADHMRHVDELGALVRGRGAMAIELPHVTGPIKMAIQAMGAATMRDANVLLALRVVEGQVHDRYEHYRERHWPVDVEPVIRTGLADEARHYRWATERAQELGVGTDSLAGSVSSAVEALHKLVASPIEAASKQLLRFVDENRSAFPSVFTGRDDRPLVAHYKRALAAVEQRAELDGMVSLFTPEATLSRADHSEIAHGVDGARQFWSSYRAAFLTVHTEFTSDADAPGVLTLSWLTRGRGADGAGVSFRGITVIEHHNGRITRLQQLFDPAQLTVAA